MCCHVLACTTASSLCMHGFYHLLLQTKEPPRHLVFITASDKLNPGKIEPLKVLWKSSPLLSEKVFWPPLWHPADSAGGIGRSTASQSSLSHQWVQVMPKGALWRVSSVNLFCRGILQYPCAPYTVKNVMGFLWQMYSTYIKTSFFHHEVEVSDKNPVSLRACDLLSILSRDCYPQCCVSKTIFQELTVSHCQGSQFMQSQNHWDWKRSWEPPKQPPLRLLIASSSYKFFSFPLFSFFFSFNYLKILSF